MRRLIAMSIIMVFMLVSAQTISFSTYSNEKSWAEYYLDAISSDAFFTDEKIKQHADYFLFDADRNGTPELVVCTNVEEYGEILYSVTEKGLSTIELPLLSPLNDEEMLNIGCVQEEGIILVSGYLKQGYIQQYLLTVTQETMQIEVLGSILDNEALSKFGNGIDHFLWNGKALSLDEYSDRMTALVDENKVLQITESGPFNYDYGDLISYLQSMASTINTDIELPYKIDKGISEVSSSEIFVDTDKIYQEAIILYERETEESDRKAYDLFVKAAEAGNSLAMGKLATMCRMGFGVEANYQDAYCWAEKGAALGDPWSLWNLGYDYLNGIGTTINYEEAFRLFTKASETDDDEVCGYAYNDIGYMYENGLYVSQEASKAVSWFKKGASLENPYAMFNLANCYLDGFGTDQSFDQALTWLERAAAQGEEFEEELRIAEQIWLVGNMLYNDIDYRNYRTNIPYRADKNIGQTWIKKAAELGNTQAIAFMESNKASFTDPVLSAESAIPKTDPQNCWTPALVREGGYEYYQSTVQTYHSVTGGLCIASVDEKDNVLEGYRPMSDHYVYRYQTQELNQYVSYLETEGFTLAYQTTEEGTDVYVYCNEEKGFALSIYIFAEQEYISIEPKVGWEELSFWTDKEYGDRDESIFGTKIQKTNNIIELQYGEARYNTGYWNVPVFQPTEHMENCTGFTLCFGYSEVDERELGEHRVYVSLDESNSAWLECQPLNVATKGEVYRLNITFEKPRTVGGIAVLPRQATENKFSAVAWIEDPVFAD